MEKIKSITAKYSSKLKYFLLLAAIIAALNSLSRADYNFVIYLFMFYVWTFMENSPQAQRQDKIGTFYILLFSLLIDVIWSCYWGKKWDTVPTVCHEMTVFLSWCGIILKILIILFVGLLEFDIIIESILSFMKKNTNKEGSFQPFKDEKLNEDN